MTPELSELVRYPFVGKGSPEAAQVALQLASFYGLTKDFQTYCDTNLGLDCNGFVGNYLRRVVNREDWDEAENKNGIGPNALIDSIMRLLPGTFVTKIEDIKATNTYVIALAHENGKIVTEHLRQEIRPHRNFGPHQGITSIDRQALVVYVRGRAHKTGRSSDMGCRIHWREGSHRRLVENSFGEQEQRLQHSPRQQGRRQFLGDQTDDWLARHRDRYRRVIRQNGRECGGFCRPMTTFLESHERRIIGRWLSPSEFAPSARKSSS